MFAGEKLVGVWWDEERGIVAGAGGAQPVEQAKGHLAVGHTAALQVIGDALARHAEVACEAGFCSWRGEGVLKLGAEHIPHRRRGLGGQVAR